MYYRARDGVDIVDDGKTQHFVFLIVMNLTFISLPYERYMDVFWAACIKI